MGLRRSRSSAGSSRGTKHPEALAGYFRDFIPEGVQVAAHTVLTGEEISSGTPVSLLLIPLFLDSVVTLGPRPFEGTLGFSFTSTSLESFSAHLVSKFPIGNRIESSGLGFGLCWFAIVMKAI